MEVKVCIVCERGLPISEFHKQKSSRDGLRGKCKECTKAYCKEYHHRNREHHRINCKQYYLDHKQECKDRVQEYREKHPEKRAAHALVTQAMRKGILIKQPCEVCGELKVEAHHDDYSKPLDVRWLCGVHHKEAHYGREGHDETR